MASRGYLSAWSLSVVVILGGACGAQRKFVQEETESTFGGESSVSPSGGMPDGIDPEMSEGGVNGLGEGGANGLGGAGAGTNAAGGEGTGESSALTVTSVEPPEGTMGSDPDTSITVTFSDELDRATTCAGSSANGARDVKLLDASDVEVAVTVTCSGKSAALAPLWPLGLGSSYQVVVNRGVRSVTGVELAESFTSHFTVRDGEWSPDRVLEPANVRGRTTPRIAVTRAGDALVTWDEAMGGVSTRLNAQWYRRSGGWQPPTVLDEADTSSYLPSVVVNAQGDAAVVWARDNKTLWSRQYRAGVWGASATELTKSSDDGYYGVTAKLLSSGALHVLTVGAQSVVARHTTPLGDWTGSTQVLNQGYGTDEYSGGLPSMGFDAEGNGIAVWRPASNKITVSRFADKLGSWGALSTLAGSTPPAGQTVQGAVVAVAPSGDAMATWSLAISDVKADLMASHFAASEGWDNPRAIDQSDGKMVSDVPSVVFDGRDYVAAWTQFVNPIWNVYTARYSAGAWQKPRLTSDGVVSASGQHPELVADGSGNLVLAWKGSTAQSQLFDLTRVRYVAADQSWSEPSNTPAATVRGQAASIWLAAGPQGQVAAAWGDVETMTAEPTVDHHVVLFQ